MADVRYKVSENFILRQVAGSNVLISVGGNIADYNGYIDLNDTAAFLWKEMADLKTVSDLVTALRGEYDVTQEQAVADVNEILQEMIGKKMVIVDE